MGRVLTKDNLDEYLNWSNRPWRAADLLYERLPMLTIRNYLSCEDDRTFPLCWTRGLGLRRGLSLCTDFLRAWKAFRPGVANTLQKQLEAKVPGIVLNVQSRIRDGLKLRTLQDLGVHKAGELVRVMSRAVAQVSGIKRLKNPNPMLGSKVMHFFFPEFFPVWDTAYVGKALSSLRRLKELDEAAEVDSLESRRDEATAIYADYLNLMLRDLRAAKDTVLGLSDRFVEHAIAEYGDKSLGRMLDENLEDLSPIVFELCVIGYGQRVGALSK